MMKPEEKTRGARFLLAGKSAGNAFTGILKRMDIPCETMGMGAFRNAKLERFSAVLFMPGYFDWTGDLEAKEAVLRKLKSFVDAGGRLYIEYVQWDDYVFRNVVNMKQNHPPRPAALERIVVTGEHYITEKFSGKEILPVRNCAFMPCRTKSGVLHLLSFAVVRGAGSVACAMPHARDTWPALVDYKKQVLFATFRMSKYAASNFPLQRRWSEIAGRTVLYLLPASVRDDYEKKLFPLEIKVSPRTWSAPGREITVQAGSGCEISVKSGRKKIRLDSAGGGTNIFSFKPENEGKYLIGAKGPGEAAGSETVEVYGREKKYSETLDRLMNWYLESGVMPRQDGKAGVYEGFRSTDHKLIPVFRSDCNAETALAFQMYGQLRKDKRYTDVAANIIDFLLREGFQDLNPRHESCGFWKFWNDYLEYPRMVWSNDNSWVGIVLFSMYERTRDEKYLKHALLTASAAYRAGLENRLAIFEKVDELNRKGAERFRRENASEMELNPFVPSMYVYAYRHTGDEKYLRKAEETAAGYRGHPSSAQTNVYSIFMFSVLYRATGKEEYARRLRRLIRKIKSRQVACGAVKNPFPNRKKTNEGYGLREVDVSHRASDTVADMLYINAPLVYNLYSAYGATGWEMCLDFFHGIMDFTARIQIRSGDRRLNGAWMRAFDYREWDYNGSNGDIDWGPYCIESGWTNAWIAKTLSAYLMHSELQGGAWNPSTGTVSAKEK